MHVLCIYSGRLREDIEDSLEVKNLETRSMRKTELEIKKELARLDILQLKESELKESIDAHKYE